MFGVHDHSTSQDVPLSIVSMHPNEDNTTFSKVHGKAWRFAEAKIGDYFNISYTEYMKLPREYTDLLFDIATTMNEKPSNAADKAKKELDAMMKG